MNLRSLRLSECKLSSLPASLLTLTELQSIDLSKNNFTTFFENDGISPVDVQWLSLTYLNLNGNQLTKVPPLCRFMPNLKQLHLHMNKLTGVEELCREGYQALETLDLGQNKIQQLPVALVFYLKNLCQLTLLNNDIQRLPHLLGRHKAIKNLQVDGNPLKTIRRPIIARGSAGVLEYLADKYVEGHDHKIEEWAEA